MGALQPWHLVVLAVAAAALFGYNKLPDVSRSVGRSLRIFQAEMKGLASDSAAGGPSSSPSDATDVQFLAAAAATAQVADPTDEEIT